jgi:hypothetical protein
MSWLVNFLESLLAMLKPPKGGIRERGQLFRNQTEANQFSRLGR